MKRALVSVQRSGALLACLAVSTSFGACGGNGCSNPPTVANLIFVDEQGVVRAQRIAGVGQTAIWDAGSFGPMLTSVPINQLTMQFEGNPGRQADAYAFAQNLDTWHDGLVAARSKLRRHSQRRPVR